MFRFVCLLPCFLVISVDAAEWPQWRGPGGQGHAPTAKDLPNQWKVGPAGKEVSGGTNIQWRTEIPGRAWSSAMIDGETLWLTTAIEHGSAQEGPPPPGGKKPQPRSVAKSVTFRALALDARDGQILEDIELFSVDNPQPTHVLNSFASPSPVLGSDRLYCQFGDYGTACVDTKKASVIWHNRSQRLNHENGPGSTPVLWEDLLIFHCDGSDVQYIVALDANTGEQVWRTDRSGEMSENPEMKKSYGTPLITSIGGRNVLLSPASDWLYGYDPNTGEELWKVDYGILGFSVVARPVVADDVVYFSTSFMKTEFLAMQLGPAAHTTPEILWRYKRSVPRMPSPVLIDDSVYLFGDKGIATCLDRHTGEAR
ncbi:MAG: PQQ-binding-like beta-propeller repeat protein, partial [Planctomycetota bacterium]|nr:PQQ-binding-like beta-propeller repeat protein [Planctomycetota bacterium]